MFFCPELLKKRGGKFFLVWVAATQQGHALQKHLTSRKVNQVDVTSIVRDIMQIVMNTYPAHLPRPLSSKTGRFSLYLSAKLMFGSCVVLQKQAILLFRDLHLVYKNLNELKWSEEKNAIIREVSKGKRGKPTEDGRKPTKNEEEAFHVGGFNFDEMDMFDFENSFGMPEGEEVELEFRNSVSEASITLAEVDFPPPRDEDMRFGDEDDPLILRTFSDVGGDAGPSMNGPEIDTNFLLHLRDADFDQQNEIEVQPVPGNLLPHVADILDDFESPPLEFHPSSTAANDAHHMSPPHDFHPSPAPRTPRTPPIRRPVDNRPSSAASQTPEQVPPTTTAAATVTPDNVDHLFGTPPELHVSPRRNAVPQGTVDDMQLPVDTHPITDSQHMDDLTRQVSTQDTRVEELSDEMQLPDIVFDPRVGRRPKRGRLIIDSNIEISNGEFSNRISTKATDTLRKRQGFEELHSMYLRSKLINMDAMRQPGRSGNINTGLKSMFSRHFVTCPEPTLELPPPPPSPVIVMSNETQDQATSQSLPINTELFQDDFPVWPELETTHFVPEQNIAEHQGKEAPFPTDPVIDLSALIPVVNSTIDTPLEPSTFAPIQESLTTENIQEPPQGGRLQRDQVSPKDTRKTKRPGDKKNENELPKPKKRRLHFDELEDRPSIEGTNTGIDNLNADEANDIRLVKTPERSMIGSQLRMTEDPPSGGRHSKTPQGSTEPVTGPPGLELAEDPISTRGLAVSPERPFELVATPPGSHLRDPSQSSSLSPPTPIQTIVSEIHQVCTEKDENTITILDLCPPATTRRRTAARTFYSLLELHKSKQVTLDQERDGDTVGPVLITLNNEDSLSSIVA